MNQVLFHFKDTYLDEVIKLGFNYVINDNEVDVILPYTDKIESINNQYIDEAEFCNYFGLDYEQVNCIELI